MDTIVALSTPLGVSGIGVVRLSGPACFDLACAIFHKREIQPRHSYLGHYHLKESEEIIDDPIFDFFEANASYTGEAMLEISCHGNPLILQKVISDCLERGCRQAEPGEFTRRAFMNGMLDLCQAEAVEDLIHSRSLQALRIARKQLGGSLSQQIESFIEKLTEQIAFIEAYLDFPEEDLPEENRKQFESQLQEMVDAITQLIQAHQFYTPLQQGIRTAIVGLPNAGKSTLLNCLLGQERAIVSDIPGTTRDFISETYMLAPYTLRLVDTAGLHATQEKLERIGIEKTHEQIQRADVVLWVIDGSQAWNSDLEALKKLLPVEKTCILINKIDLGIHSSIRESLKSFYICAEIALKGMPSNQPLQHALRQFLQRRYQDFSQVNFMIHERHAEALKDAQTALVHAQHLLHQHSFDDCIAEELKNAMHAFESIIGKIDYERVLDQIFSKFCIGK